MNGIILIMKNYSFFSKQYDFGYNDDDSQFDILKTFFISANTANKNNKNMI